MTFLGFTGLLNALTSLFLGAFVFYKNPKGIANRAYLNVCLSVAIYSVGYFFWQFVSTTVVQIAWFQITVAGIILINPAFIHFVFAFTGKLQQKKNALFLIYFINIVFIYFNSALLFYRGFIPKFDLGLWPIPTFLFSLYLIFWFFQVFYGFMYFLIGFRESTGHKREQLKYCILAAAIGFMGGVSNWPMWYNIHFPPYANILISVYACIGAYAIVRHKVLDIEVVIKKTLVFAGLFGLMFGVFAGVVSFVSFFLLPAGRVNLYSSIAISIFLIILLHDPFKNFLVNITNRYLFQKKYSPGKILRDFANEVLTILNLDRLCKVTAETLVNNLYLANCAILLLSREEIGYEIYDSIGIEDKGIYLDTESELMKSLRSNSIPLLYQSYDKVLQASDAVKKDMDKICSHLCIPLIIHSELVGILSLGPKKSDQEYSAEDIDILTTLTKALSIAISNARLFMQAAQNEKLATIGTITSAINHEICGPLSRISMQMQMYLNDKDEKSPKAGSDKAEQIMSNTMEEIKKVTDITSKLSGFAKPSNIVASKPVDIEKVLDESLTLLRHKLEETKITVTKSIAKELSKIIADEHQLQQIFFNLIRNAIEAIGENGTVTISAKEDAKAIRVEIKDTGCGIPKDNLDKVFKPFYTTKGGAKGSGYGLAVVKELVQRNNGSIKVESKVGNGTVFYLEFQKA